MNLENMAANYYNRPPTGAFTPHNLSLAFGPREVYKACCSSNIPPRRIAHMNTLSYAAIAIIVVLVIVWFAMRRGKK